MATRLSVSLVEIRGHALQSLVAAMTVRQNRVLKILSAHGITSLGSGDWYPMKQAMDAYHQIQTEIGPNTIKTAGRKMPEFIEVPPHLTCLKDALTFIHVGYQMHHRGPGNIGGYRYETTGERKGRMICDNPYPCELDEGLIEAVCEKYRPKDALWIRVEHHPGICRKQGDSACIYEVLW